MKKIFLNAISSYISVNKLQKRQKTNAHYSHSLLLAQSHARLWQWSHWSLGSGVIDRLVCKRRQFENSNFVCVGGVTASMVAFQAIDPGSTPGRRKIFSFYFLVM